MAAGAKSVESAKKKRSFRTKASIAVAVTGVSVISLVIVGFATADDEEREVNADCVDWDDYNPDGSYLVVDDDHCEDDDGNTYIRTYGSYYWYYGGRHVNGRVMSGSTVKPSDVRIVSRSGTVIQRGGFGGRGSGGG
ncbi:hypothetical protein [Sinosporangium siamense]|uniref:Uncharacterized protein n=1 Tax=Sinosporangium siamense TaxID=1367973 RepID=A0A919VB65_9ACTN|nr:hypothetical protein [Sinosporangium siamense]GII91804.1 hypothetical protein Ssi02_20350 [Sinosporangium siamense]